MAKGIKSGGRNFLPGTSGNLNGRPPLPPEIRDAINTARTVCHQDIIEIRETTHEKLKGQLGKLPAGKAAIASAYIEMNHAAIKIYEDRLFGKAKEQVDISTDEITKIVIKRIPASK